MLKTDEKRKTYIKWFILWQIFFWGSQECISCFTWLQVINLFPVFGCYLWVSRKQDTIIFESYWTKVICITKRFLLGAIGILFLQEPEKINNDLKLPSPQTHTPIIIIMFLIFYILSSKKFIIVTVHMYQSSNLYTRMQCLNKIW